MVTWKRLLVVFVVLLLGLLASVFIFLKGYKPTPNKLRSLVFVFLPNYKIVSWVADLTKNQQLVLGYFMEDVIKYPENFVNQAVDKNGFGKTVVDTSVVQPFFHKDLFNLNGRVITVDKNRMVVEVSGVNYVVKVRDFSLVYVIDLKIGTPAVNEFGLVRNRIGDLVDDQSVSLVVYKVAGGYELLSVSII